MRTNPTQQSTLLDTYLDYHNLALRSTTNAEPKRDGMPFMPMLLMDAMYLTFDKWIEPLDVKHKEKNYKTRWHKAYNHYTKGFYFAFSEEQGWEISDILNDFHDYISNHLELFRVVVMNHFMHYEIDVRLILSATYTCNLLAQSAQILHKALHGKHDLFIATVEDCSFRFLDSYANRHLNREVKNIDLKKFEDTNILISQLCDKIIEYAKNMKI